MTILRRFKYDKALRLCGSRIPEDDEVEVVRFMPRRRVLILHNGELLTTMLWCLRKIVLERD